PVEGFTNLKVGEIFYLPMVEVVSYLRANDFKIFLVSGAERAYTRILAEVLAVDSDNIIGTDYRYVADNQGDKDGMDYVYKTTDKLVRGDFVSKNINTNKVNLIAREIGKQPVLAFGNSSGDYSMFNYTSTNPKYKTKIFALLCDDTEREFGKPSSAEKMKKAADENGWITISMKNDWTTIYGDNVRMSE
ncbi:MAG: haloacid dehalogenase-like hydrolase, partial [Selenomonadaceae bacterium]|nr:haloacid dehalogenase-like hydrolase [Selenomonadaceae bacterium]